MLQRPRCFLVAAASPEPRKGLLRPLAVMPRGSVHWFSMQGDRIPAHARPQALRLRLLQASPFARTAFAWFERGGMLCAWYWDEAESDQRFEAYGLGPANPVCPEPLLRALPEEGVLLLSCLEGYEGVRLSPGMAPITCWWPRQPDDAEWVEFLRDAGLSSDLRRPHPVSLPWLEKPAQPVHVVRTRVRDGQIAEYVFYAALVFAAGAVALWFALWQLILSQALKDAQASHATLSSRLEAVLRDREAAELDAAAVAELAGSEAGPEQVQLLLAVAQTGVGVGQKFTLDEWDVRNGKLRAVVRIEAGDASRVALLRAIEAIEGVRNVRIQVGNDPRMLVVTAELRANGGGSGA